MLIAKAYAAAETAVTAIPDAPSAMEAFGLNMLLIAILVLMFYVLLIMPQQKRFAQHREMLNALKKGDRVVTVGGLLGTVDSVNETAGEIVLDLGNNIKVSVLRHSIQSRPAATTAVPLADKKAEKADKK